MVILIASNNNTSKAGEHRCGLFTSINTYVISAKGEESFNFSDQQPTCMMHRKGVNLPEAKLNVLPISRGFPQKQ